jgi:hypothetical protein
MALDETLRRALADVLGRRAPRLRRLAGGSDLGDATDAELDEVCQALTDELVETGFGPGGEPNERGRSLQRLIDEVNPARLRRLKGR